MLWDRGGKSGDQCILKQGLHWRIDIRFGSILFGKNFLSPVVMDYRNLVSRKTLNNLPIRCEIGVELGYIICLPRSNQNDTSTYLNSTNYSDDYESAHCAAEA